MMKQTDDLLGDKSKLYNLFHDLSFFTKCATQDYFNEEYLKFFEELQSKDITIMFKEQGDMFMKLVETMAIARDKEIPKIQTPVKDEMPLKEIPYEPVVKPRYRYHMLPGLDLKHPY